MTDLSLIEIGLFAGRLSKVSNSNYFSIIYISLGKQNLLRIEYFLKTVSLKSTKQSWKIAKRLMDLLAL